MDQLRMGAFLKTLRKEKGLTQEELAEKLCVSARTVSRWETGSNIPDLSVLVEIADFYDVDIREIINGERKSAKMEEELKDTLKQVASYSDAEKKKLKNRMIDISVSAAIILLFALLVEETHGFGFISEKICGHLRDFAEGFVLAILVLNILYYCGILDKIRKWAKSTKTK